MIGIYIVTNLVNGKRYIGQSKNIQRRFWEHRCITHEENKELRADLIQYGKENFSYEVLEECEPEQLDDKERYYIAELKPEYNIATGGQDSLRKYPPETIEKIRQKAKEQWANMSEEEKQRVIKNNLIGPRKGHPVSEKVIQMLRTANLGKKQSPETIAKRKETMRQKKLNGWVKPGKSCWKKVRCIETNEVFESVKAAGKHFGFNPTSISSVLKGRYNSTHGYHFEYWT